MSKLSFTLAVLLVATAVGWRAVLAESAVAAESPAGAVPAPDAVLVEVCKPDHSRQCEPDSGTPLATMAAELTDAGIIVQGSRVGQDGMMRTAVCGAATGNLNVFTINAEDLAAAQGLGFRPFGQ